MNIVRACQRRDLNLEVVGGNSAQDWSTLRLETRFVTSVWSHPPFVSCPSLNISAQEQYLQILKKLQDIARYSEEFILHRSTFNLGGVLTPSISFNHFKIASLETRKYFRIMVRADLSG